MAGPESIGLTPQSMGFDPRLSVGPGPSSFPLQGTLHHRILQVVTTRFDQATDACKTQFSKFHRYDRIIEMISKRKQYDWKANVYLPYALQAVEQGAAMKFLMAMRSRPLIHVKERRAAPPEVADHREGLLDWHFDGDIDIVSLLGDMLRSGERYGKAIALVVPDWDNRTQRYRGTQTIPTIYGPIARMAWKTDTSRAYRIIAENQDLINCRPAPGYRRINGKGGMPWFCRQYWKTIDELWEMEMRGEWGPAIGGVSVAEITGSTDVETDEFHMRRMLLNRQDTLGHDRDKFTRSVHIIEYQGNMPQEAIDPTLAQAETMAGMNPRERVVLVANRKHCGGSQAIPWDHGFKSFVDMDCIPNLYDFWGKGKIEPIEHLIYLGNQIVNMRADNVVAAINGLIGVDGNRMPAGWRKRLVSQPFGVHETLGSPQEIIQRLQLGDVTASSYQEQQAVYSLIQDATSLNETVIGAPGGAVRTLGEQQLKAEASSRRLNFELSLSLNQLFSAKRERPGLVHFILMLDRQYMPLPQYVNIVRPGMPDTMAMFQVTPADLAEDLESFSFTPSGAIEATENQTARVEMAQLLATLQPYMELAIMGGLDIMDLLKQTFRAHNLDTSRLFPRFPTGPMQQLQQGMMARPQGQPGDGGAAGAERGGGGGVVPFRAPGVAGGGLRPEQRAAPGNRPTPPWEGGSQSGGRYRPGNPPSDR